MVANAATHFFGDVGGGLVRSQLDRQGLPPPPAIQAVPRILYNPGLDKMVPFFVIGCFDVFLVLTAGVWIFKLPVHGNPLLLVAGTFAYLLYTLGIGLLISSISKTQQQSFLAGFLFIMPAILLSGIMTPVAAMPSWLRLFTYVNPVRYFIEILRANLLKGAGFGDLHWQLGVLAGLGFGILLVASLRFRKRMA